MIDTITEQSNQWNWKNADVILLSKPYTKFVPDNPYSKYGEYKNLVKYSSEKASDLVQLITDDKLSNRNVTIPDDIKPQVDKLFNEIKNIQNKDFSETKDKFEHLFEQHPVNSLDVSDFADLSNTTQQEL